MKKLILAAMVTLLVSGCASNKMPVCYNKANIVNRAYEIPVFKKENGRYLAGYPFYSWEDKSAFIDTSECDRLDP